MRLMKTIIHAELEKLIRVKIVSTHLDTNVWRIHSSPVRVLRVQRPSRSTRGLQTFTPALQSYPLLLVVRNFRPVLLLKQKSQGIYNQCNQSVIKVLIALSIEKQL